MKSLLEVFTYVDENDIVHRDIKPNNIRFESHQEYSIRLIDFGLSRRHKKGKAPKRKLWGTLFHIMSPELVKGNYDRSCDL